MDPCSDVFPFKIGAGRLVGKARVEVVIIGLLAIVVVFLLPLTSGRLGLPLSKGQMDQELKCGHIARQLCREATLSWLADLKCDKLEITR